MTTTRLEAELRSIGLTVTVEAHGRLAVLIAADDTPLLDPATRRAATQLARQHGFTHLALELAPNDDGATLPRH